jgi:hypothetical protein
VEVDDPKIGIRFSKENDSHWRDPFASMKLSKTLLLTFIIF